jgi:hypothetical protein
MKGKTMFKVFSGCVTVAVMLVMNAAFATAGSIQLEDTLHKKTAIFGIMHKKASRALVNAAHDEAFLAYFNASSDSERKKMKGEIEAVALVAQKRFVVDEMCLIDHTGQEVARIVFDKVAPDEALSPDESGAPFFKPSFEKKDKEVHVQSPYLSADAQRWVIAYTTPIVNEDGSTPAFLHYEMPLEKYQNEMGKDLKGKESFIVIVDRNGISWVDSRYTYNLKGDPETAKANDYFPRLEKKIFSTINPGKTGKGNFKQNGKSYSVAYKPAGYFDWTIAVVTAE